MPTRLPTTTQARRGFRLFKPGQVAPASGQYVQIGPRGGKGLKVTVVKGEPLPPTPRRRMSYVLVNPTRNKFRRGEMPETYQYKKPLVLRERNQLTIPNLVAKRLQLREGSTLVLEVDAEGVIRLSPARVVPVAGSKEAGAAEIRGEVQARMGAPLRTKREIQDAFEDLRPK